MIIPRPRRGSPTAYADELADRLTTVDHEPRHHWFTPDGDYVIRDTNYYGDGPSRIVGWRRSKRIRADLKQRCPVITAPGPPVDIEDFPRRFDGENVPERVARFQAKHPARGASILRQTLVGSALAYDYRYSLATQLGGMS